MSLSRERAVDLSHRMADRLAKEPGIELTAEKEYLRNQVVRFLLEWDKEEARLSQEVRKRLATRGRRVTEGSREWDLLYAEEMEKALAELLGRGE